MLRNDDGQTTEQTVPLRIATWNVNHWQRTLEQRANAWGSVLGGLGDVALLHETVPRPTCAFSQGGHGGSGRAASAD
jgi:hypothetical protein